MYDLDFLKTFNGNMSPYDVDISQLANVTEKYVSQYEYIYDTEWNDCPNLMISVMNESIPHLLGLSEKHHLNLARGSRKKIFDNLKFDLTLEKLKNSDSYWFDSNKDKLIGVLFLYQMLNLVDCEIYSTKRFSKQPAG